MEAGAAARAWVDSSAAAAGRGEACAAACALCYSQGPMTTSLPARVVSLQALALSADCAVIRRPGCVEPDARARTGLLDELNGICRRFLPMRMCRTAEGGGVHDKHP